MSDQQQTTGLMWGGRFDGQADELFRAFNDSLSFDWALVHEDLFQVARDEKDAKAGRRRPRRSRSRG